MKPAMIGFRMHSGWGAMVICERADRMAEE